MYLAKATEEDHWQIESDYRTLAEAQDILKDEGRLKKVQEFAKKQKESIEEISEGDFFKKIGLGE